MDSYLKKRYNYCHRLRLCGVAVDTKHKRISLPDQAYFVKLDETPRKYIRTLCGEYRFVVQYAIQTPDEIENPLDTVKFRRK